MIRINLLPYRVEQRQERRRQFYLLSALLFALGALIVFMGNTVYDGYIERQDERNNIFRRNISELDVEISEIKTLKEQIHALLARKQVIESLQVRRTEIVRVFNELAERIPAGVYLTSLEQQGNRLTLVGKAQANARVPALMRALGESSVFDQLELVETTAEELKSPAGKGREVEKRIVYKFSITLLLKALGDGEEGAKDRGE